MPGARILLVEDDHVLCGLLLRNLEARGGMKHRIKARRYLHAQAPSSRTKTRCQIMLPIVPMTTAKALSTSGVTRLKRA